MSDVVTRMLQQMAVKGNPFKEKEKSKIIQRYVLVTGTGRSGTSTTARILHERLGVCMGHEFIKAKGKKLSRNPLGFWEEIHERMTKMTKGLAKGTVSAEQWRGYLDAAHDRHGCKSKLRGYKHPRLAEIPSERTWAELDPLLVIEAWRPRELVMQSMIFASPKNVTGCIDRYYERRKNMDRHLRGVPVFVIKFKKVLSDDQVFELLRPKIEGLR